MSEDEVRVFRRSAAAYVLNGVLLGLFLAMSAMGIRLGHAAAVFVSFAAALWEVVFGVWLYMYPYARLQGGSITLFARFQQRKAIPLEEVAGLERVGNALELSLKNGEAVSLSLFWMDPADREPFAAALRPRGPSCTPPAPPRHP